MSTLGWLLLLIVVVCVIALIIIAIKRKELEESISEEPETEGEKVVTAPAPKKAPKKAPPAPVETGPKQITIYAHASSGKMGLCPHCDGENMPGVTHCYICGQQIG